jgi:glycosyltransferase involved in cell wall biosynthesis
MSGFGVTVSVIVPNYNHAGFLDQRIASVLNQTYQDYELIILDDASTDDSIAIIDKYRSNNHVKHIVCNSINSGSTFSQWKKGISLAAGNYIWLAESDDFADKRFLATCMEAFNTYTDLSLVYTNSKVVDERGGILHEDLSFWYDDVDPQKWQKTYLEDGRSEILQALSYKNTIPNASAVVFRKQFFDELLKFKYCGDWLFWIKLLETNQRVMFIRETLNNFRSHAATTRMATYTLEKSRRFLRERAGILSYLKKRQLIQPEVLHKQWQAIVHDWKNLFTVSEIFNKDFFVPGASPVAFIGFIYQKSLSGVRRLQHALAK